MKTETPTWRPPRITAAGVSFAGLAPRGHLIVGVLAGDELDDITETEAAKALRIQRARRADRVMLAEVLDVGPGCPGVNVGDQVIIQRFSGAGRLWDGMSENSSRAGGEVPSSGLNPDWIGVGHDEALARYSAVQIVRCGNGIRAQEAGLDDALVNTAVIVAGLRRFVKSDEGRTADDPKMIQPRKDLAKFEALLGEILRRRAGKCVNGAVIAAGLQTGDDGAVFDGVIAVVEG